MSNKKLNLEEIKYRVNCKHNGSILILSDNYRNNKEKLDCYCIKHATAFKCSFNKLMKIKLPCPLCNSKINSQVIPLLKEIHNNIYEYVEPIERKLNVICKIHGVFTQDLYSHINGYGCFKCAGFNKTNEDFIKDCNNRHNHKYDYSKTIYKDAFSKIVIICKTHGVFTQRPNNHLNGQGCALCADNLLNKEEFINELTVIHNNKYNYDNIHVVNRQSYISVNCYIHGYFDIKLSRHLNGTGCKNCAIDSLKSNTKEFIEKSEIIHNNTYDYSLTKYTGNKKHVEILCKKHGMFKQVANYHLSGAGCPKCRTSKGELKIMNYLKENNIDYIYEYKFSNCKNILPLPFDFYLPEFNTCIEFDGIQHFKINEFFGGEASFNNTKLRDVIKTKFCFDNNIDLIRIPYFHLNNINEILELKIKKAG